MADKKHLVQKTVQLTPAKIIAIAFAVIILAGAILLTLPVASRSGVSCGFRSALFTATSATCVTGLVLFDTWTQWSGFGLTVILCMIEIGGLGFMSVASLAFFAFRKEVGLRQRMLMAQALSVNEMEGVVRLQKWVLLGSLIIQSTGAFILFLRFLPDYGLRQSATWAVFHAVSAFCNAGFDITGSIAPGANLIVFNKDPVVCITVMALIVIGGLGFLVWEDVVTTRSFKKCSIYTKLVLLTTVVLIVGGALLIAFFEWSNPATLGKMSVPHKILNAFFQSVTVRTAGFTSIDQASMTDAAKAVSMFLMLVGGSSGSTAGGIKTVTFLVLVLSVITWVRGKKSVTVFHRTIPQEKILDAVTITSVMTALATAGAVFITATSPVGFTDALYETVSALATVGLTAGVTTSLSISAQLLIIAFMYFGRVGILTLALGFLAGDKAEDRFRYAHTNLLIG